MYVNRIILHPGFRTWPHLDEWESSSHAAPATKGAGRNRGDLRDLLLGEQSHRKYLFHLVYVSHVVSGPSLPSVEYFLDNYVDNYCLT